MKKANWCNYKATQVRSSWRARAKKYGLNLDEVPTRAEIQVWLEAQMPIKCYIAGSFISTETVEIDHRIPLSRGGNLSLDNCAVTSRYYNNVKGALTEKEFRSLLKAVNKWEDKGSALFKRLMASNHVFNRGRK